MNTHDWTDLLYGNEAITSALPDEQAQQLLSWAESHLATCETETDAMHLLDAMRRLNRYVEEGENFDQLFAALRAKSSRSPSDGDTPAPGDLDADIDTIYPPQS